MVCLGRVVPVGKPKLIVRNVRRPAKLHNVGTVHPSLRFGIQNQSPDIFPRLLHEEIDKLFRRVGYDAHILDIERKSEFSNGFLSPESLGDYATERMLMTEHQFK
jgi:hypothetical protein